MPRSEKWYKLCTLFILYFNDILKPGVSGSLLYNGSRFCGHQKSKGNQYDVEVVLQVEKD